jgi:hypothetical protein
LDPGTRQKWLSSATFLLFISMLDSKPFFLRIRAVLARTRLQPEADIGKIPTFIGSQHYHISMRDRHR